MGRGDLMRHSREEVAKLGLGMLKYRIYLKENIKSFFFFIIIM